VQTTYPIGETKQACLITWLSCMDLKGNPYTKVSVDKTRELLAKKHKRYIERRWCFQCTADLIGAGLITRQPRHPRMSDGTVRQISSMIAFTLKGVNYLISKGVEKAIVIRKQILAWMKNLDKRFPAANEILPVRSEEVDTEGLRRFKALAGKVGKPMPG